MVTKQSVFGVGLITYRQQVLVKSIVKVKAERARSSEPSSTLDSGKSSTSSQDSYPQSTAIADTQSPEAPTADTTKAQGGLLGLAYESEDDSDGEPEDIPAAKRPKDQRDE